MVKIKEEKAVTLTALLITIIIILILSSVGIYITIGPNGIIEKSKQGVSAYTEQSIREKMELKLDEWQIEFVKSGEQITIGKIKKLAQEDEEISRIIENGDNLILIVDEYQCEIDKNLSIVGNITVYNPQTTIMKAKTNLEFCTIER